MGMVTAQHVTHAGGGLLEGMVAGQVILVHGVENPPVDRLETIPYVRQGAAHDDAHGVFDVGLLHLRYERRFHDLLVGETDFLGVVLGFLTHE